MDLAQRRGLSRGGAGETLREEGAVAEALELYLSADGRVVVAAARRWPSSPEDIGRKNRAAAGCGGARAKAEAILAVCAHHRTQAAGRRRGRGAADDRAFAPINAKFLEVSAILCANL